jgi:hypothetical protein
VITIRLVPCSRWTELGDALRFHVEFARAARAPTEFRFLNSLPPVLIGGNDFNEEESVTTLYNAMSGTPSGGTPLCRHIREIVEKIRAIEPQLRASGQKAALIIATDGESSDGNVVTAMRPLKDLPVMVVVRLCTNNVRIGKYWSDVDCILGSLH